MTFHTSIAPALAAYVCTDDGAALARSAVERSGAGEETLRGGGLSGAARLCSGTPLAGTLLCEMGNIPVDMACDCVAELRRSGAQVIVIGHQNDMELYRALRRAGALDYFPFPVRVEDILALHDQPAPEDPRPAPPTAAPATRSAFTLGVVGGNGGVGASLLARNLASHAARQSDARVALIDADLRFGTQALDLDVDATPGLIEALDNPARIDATFLAATMSAATPRLSLYSHPIRAGQDATELDAGFPALTNAMRGDFGAIVLDLPRALALDRPEDLAGLDAVAVIAGPGYAGISSASRLIQRIGAAAPDLRLLTVLSDLRRDAGLTRAEMEHGLGQAFAAVLPRCDKAVLAAHRAATGLVDRQPRSDYARAAAALWSRAREEEAETRSLFGRLFK